MNSTIVFCQRIIFEIQPVSTDTTATPETGVFTSDSHTTAGQCRHFCISSVPSARRFGDIRHLEVFATRRATSGAKQRNGVVPLGIAETVPVTASQTTSCPRRDRGNI